MLIRAATVVQVLQDLLCVLLHVLLVIAPSLPVDAAAFMQV